MGKTLFVKTPSFFIFILLKVYPWTLMPPSIGWSVGLSQFHKAVKLKLSFYTPIRALFVLLQQISRSDKLNTVSLIKKNVTHPWPPKFAPSGRAIISASWYDQIAGMTNKIPVFFMPFLCLNLAKIAKTIERFVFHESRRVSFQHYLPLLHSRQQTWDCSLPVLKTHLKPSRTDRGTDEQREETI